MTVTKFDTGFIRKETSIFKADNIDRNRWNRAVDSGVSPAINNPVEGYPVERDAFLSLLQSNPTLENRDMSDTEQHMGQLFNRAMNVPQFQNLRQKTVNNPLHSGIACTGMVDGIMFGLSDDVKNDMAQQASKQQQAQQALQEAISASEMAKNFEDSGQQELADDWQETADKLNEQAEKLQQQAEKLQGEIESELAESGTDIDYAIAKAADKASDELDKVSAVFRGFSEATGQDSNSFSPEVVRGLMEIIQNHPNLDYFVKCLGWAMRMVGTIERQMAEGRVDIVEIESAPLEMDRMTDTEKMNLAEAVDPALTDDFYGRLVDDAVMHYVFQGTSPLGHGPLVLVTDQSGSMGWNDNHSMVVALKWAIFGMCGRQDRVCVDIAFAGLNSFTEYDNRTGTPEEYMAHLQTFDGGGTEPYRPMVRAMEIVREITEQGEQSGGDVVLFTDDDFGTPLPLFVSDLEHTKKVTDESFKLVSVVLGSFYHGQSHQCENFSDLTLFLADLMVEENRDKLAAMMAEVL